MTQPTMEPIHPGEILMLDYLESLGITQHRVTVAIGVPPRHNSGYRQRVADSASHQLIARFPKSQPDQLVEERPFPKLRTRG